MNALPPLEKREYQERLITKAMDAFIKENCSSVLIESPTGSGKTVVALQILQRLKEWQPNLTFGWVAMRRKLLQQAELENSRVGVKDIRFISMFDHHPPACDLMCIDEGHHDSAATCAALHKAMKAKWSLALTATPFRTDRIKLCFEKIINDYGIRFLVEQGYLSNFDQFVMPRWTPKDVATYFLSERERWGKSIIFMRTEEFCQQTCELLKRGGVPAAVMLGSLPQVTKDLLFDQFDDNKLQVLVNIQLLTEGFDCPDLRTVWVRDSGKLCTMQMCGRVLRKDPDNPAKIAQVVQSEDAYPFTKVVKPREQYVWREGGGWRSVRPGKDVEQVAERVREQLLKIPVQLPSFIVNREVNNISVNKKGKLVERPRKVARNDLVSFLASLSTTNVDDLRL